MIYFDPDQLEEIMRSLLKNAWESIEMGSLGEVLIEVKTVNFSHLDVTHIYPGDWIAEKDTYACISVKDTGKGISETTIHKIFDPFFSDKFTGRGLGLAIVLGNIKAHNSCILVDSKPDEGSLFRVLIPRN